MNTCPQLHRQTKRRRKLSPKSHERLDLLPRNTNPTEVRMDMSGAVWMHHTHHARTSRLRPSQPAIFCTGEAATKMGSQGKFFSVGSKQKIWARRCPIFSKWVPKFRNIRRTSVWYDMTWHDMIWYDKIWYDVIWNDNDVSDGWCQWWMASVTDGVSDGWCQWWMDAWCNDMIW